MTTPPRHTYVVAAAYDDAAAWCKRHRIPTEGLGPRAHRIITDPADFLGLRITPDDRVVIVGAVSRLMLAALTVAQRHGRTREPQP